MINHIRRQFSARPFNILGVQQVAIGGLSKQNLTNFWTEHMGLQKEFEMHSTKENTDEDMLVMGKGVLGTVALSLMEPLDPEKSPKVHKPALNHIGLWVDDLPKAVEYLEGQDIKCVGGIRAGAHGHDLTFIHPKSACGTLIELVQAPSEVIDEYSKNEK